MNKFCNSNGHHLETLHTALTKCIATPTPPTFCKDLTKKRKWWIDSLPPCMQGLWRLCCNEAVCIMHELAFERHAAPNVVIFCLLFLSHPFLPPRLPSLFPPSWASLLQPSPLCLHLINYCFVLLVGGCWIVASGRRKGERDSKNYGRKTSCSQEMPCHDKTSC